MRTVTKIQQQKKALHRYNIFLNEKYAFSVDEDILVQYHIHKGMELSKQAVEDIMNHEDVHRNYVMAINFLSYRMRSAQEIRTYLRGKEVAPSTIVEIMERLEKEKLIDDHAFARAFVRDRIQRSSKGPRVIMNELQEKGVTSEIANEAVLQYSEEKQFNKAYKWAQKEAVKKSQHAVNKRKDQLRNKLMQKGFASTVVSAVMGEIIIEADPEEEFLRLEKQANTLRRRYEKKHDGYELKMKIKAALYNRRFSGELIDKYIEKMDQSR